MFNDIERVSVSKEEIEKIVKRLGSEISKDYQDKNPLIIGLLKGTIFFMVDLLKNIDIKCTLDFMKASSYSGASSTGNVMIKGDIPEVDGRHVILIDDILDTGRTIKSVKELFESRNALSVKVCVLLNKPEGRVVDIEADYVGGLVENEFVVGYGLDYDEQYRNLPYIGVLKREVYSK